MAYEAVSSKLEKIARLDYECNGSFMNQPYRTVVDGILYKGIVIIDEGDMGRRHDIRLRIIRPETIVANVALMTVPNPNWEDK